MVFLVFNITTSQKADIGIYRERRAHQGAQRAGTVVRGIRRKSEGNRLYARNVLHALCDCFPKWNSRDRKCEVSDVSTIIFKKHIRYSLLRAMTRPSHWGEGFDVLCHHPPQPFFSPRVLKSHVVGFSASLIIWWLFYSFPFPSQINNICI